jgi:hypothetical protein
MPRRLALKLMHRPARISVGLDGSWNGLLAEVEAGAEIIHQAIIIGAIG